MSSKITEDQLLQHLLTGKQTKYNDKKHIALLINVFMRGEGVMAFCADALICKDTFYRWLNTYEKFRNAYHIVLCSSGRIWERMPLVDNRINHQYWYLIMKNRFGYGNLRIPEPNKTNETEIYQNRQEQTYKLLSNAEISLEDSVKLSQLNKDNAIIFHVTKNAKDIKDLQILAENKVT